jgi:hypothetical protein
MSQPAWMYHFGLTTPPFAKDVGDDDLWLPSARSGVVSDLVEVVHERQHVVLVHLLHPRASHPRELRVGLEASALARPRRALRPLGPAHARPQPLSLVPHPRPPQPRRGEA